jgi:hypothetical protein
LATLRHGLSCRSTTWASHRLASFVSRSVTSITSSKTRRSFRFHRTVQNRCREAPVAVWKSALSPTRGWDVLSALKFLLRPQARYSWCAGIILGLKKRLEVAAGLEPAKTGFADQRLDRFGIATKPCKACTLNLVQPGPWFIPKTVPKCPRNAYLPLFKSL